MKVSFKPLSLAIAVSAAVAGYAGSINATPTLAGNTVLGDAAIVPYYTVRGDWTTGVSIVNTSASTQVVKVRLRRATDSMDVMDFNLVLSPEDVWTGYLENNIGGSTEDQMRFYTNDKSCTVPALTPNANGAPYIPIPDVNSNFAEEGYIEIIGMGAVFVEAYPMAVMALHSKTTGIPAACALLQDNFQRFAGLNVWTPSIVAVNEATFCPPTNPPTVNQCSTGNVKDGGVVNSTQTVTNGLITNYKAPGNFMKVSWFIKDTTTGIEMGDNAVMLADFMDGPSMTNQLQQSLVEDLQGYDYPNLNGAAPLSAAGTNANPTAASLGVRAGSNGQYNSVRDILGSGSAINEWSKNVKADLSVDTDWVVTVPGQYTMLNLPVYIASITGASGFDPASKLANANCIRGTDATWPPVAPVAPATLVGCDYRDLPLTITPKLYNREELSETTPPDKIVVSPTPPGTVVTNELFYEVNVIQWGDNPVLDAAASTAITIDLGGAVNGWAQLDMASTTKTAQAVCTYVVTAPVAPAVASTGVVNCTAATGNAPIVGFAAWQRSFETNPDANYGRAIGNSYGPPTR